MKRITSLLILLYLSGIAFAQPKYHKDYSELKNPAKTNPKAWAKIRQPLYASFVSKDDRFAKEAAPNLPREVNFWGETGWRGERLCAQLLLWSGVGASEVQVKFSDLETSRGEKIKAENCAVEFVRYVMSDSYGKDGCASRRSKDFDSTLVADVLEYRPSINVKAQTVQPVWLSFNIPAQTPPGKYKGFITITAKGMASPITFTTNIFVREHVLPPPAGWKFRLDMWQNPYAAARYHNVAPWSKAHFDAMRPAMQLLAQAGQKSITLPLENNSVEGRQPNETESLLTFIRRVNSTWSIDYTKFDLWVEFMMGLGIDRELHCYLGSTPLKSITYFDQASFSVKTQDLTEQEYNDFVKSAFGLFTAHLREKGWLSKTYICVKETGKDRLRKIIGATAKADSAYHISYLGSYFPDVEKSVSAYSVAQLLPLDAAQKSARAQAGRTLAFYQPCSDVQPNTFLFSPPAEAAWIGWYAAANGFDGYTRQHYNSWGQRPLQDARGPKRPAGFYSMAYPDGRSSVRMERLVEGIQDFEKIKILQQRFEQTNNVVQREKLQKLLNTFTTENLKTKPAGVIIEEARMILNSL